MNTFLTEHKIRIFSHRRRVPCLFLKNFDVLFQINNIIFRTI